MTDKPLSHGAGERPSRGPGSDRDITTGLSRSTGRTGSPPKNATVPEPTTVATASDGFNIAEANQWQLMWRRFHRHKLAVVSLWFLVVMYTLAAFCEFVSPYTPDTRDVRYLWGAPQGIHFRHPEKGLSLRPFVYGYERVKDPENAWSVKMRPNPSKTYRLSLFKRGEPYTMWGLLKTDIHLFGVTAADGTPAFIHLLGTDKQGRDIFTRILYGSRISLTIGLVGVAITIFLGIIIGGVAGYAAGWVDLAIQRFIEVLQSIPKLPLWMALSAALPTTWSGVKVYFGITIILSFFGWTGLARVVRSKFLSLRDEDFVVAARLLGAARGRIIFRHLLPSFMSHIITTATMAIPAMILGETGLSFLGIGMRPPTVSWGVLLQDGQNITAVVLMPWLLIPGLCVVLVVLAFNLMGDGLRDAADPYH